MVVTGWSDQQADCRLMFEGNIHPMWVFSARGIVDVNQAALLHYAFSREEFLSMSVADLETNKKKDGSVVDVELSSFAITFGGLPATLRSASDVTHLRRAAAQTCCIDLLLATTLGSLVASDARAEETLRALLANVITAQEGERRRVACELDDETAQTLVSVLVGLRAVEGAEDLPRACDAAGTLTNAVAAVLRAVDRIASDLRPSILDRLGLEPALEHLALQASRTSAFCVDFQVTGAPVLLPESTEIALYRIAQEALTNAGKHAAAKTVGVFVQRNDDAVRLVIEDDGIGFAVAALPSATQLGLMGMRERAFFIGGSMTVRSSLGHGTTLCVRAPLPRPADVWARALS